MYVVRPAENVASLKSAVAVLSGAEASTRAEIVANVSALATCWAICKHSQDHPRSAFSTSLHLTRCSNHGRANLSENVLSVCAPPERFLLWVSAVPVASVGVRRRTISSYPLPINQHIISAALLSLFAVVREYARPQRVKA